MKKDFGNKFKIDVYKLREENIELKERVLKMGVK